MGTGLVVISCEGDIFLNKKDKPPTPTESPVFSAGESCPGPSALFPGS